MNYHPHERAPRCLPCHWSQEDEERSLRADGYRPFQPYVGCPCTAEVICKTDDRGFFGDACEMPLWKPDSEGRDFRVYTYALSYHVLPCLTMSNSILICCLAAFAHFTTCLTSYSGSAAKASTSTRASHEHCQHHSKQRSTPKSGTLPMLMACLMMQ